MQYGGRNKELEKCIPSPADLTVEGVEKVVSQLGLLVSVRKHVSVRKLTLLETKNIPNINSRVIY